MLPSIKMEEYMEPEVSGILWVGSPGTHFMHMRVKKSGFLIKSLWNWGYDNLPHRSARVTKL